MKYRWLGNVRELQNIMERAVVVGPTDWMPPDDLPREILSPEPGVSALDSFNLETIALAAQRAAVERTNNSLACNCDSRL